MILHVSLRFHEGVLYFQNIVQFHCTPLYKFSLTPVRIVGFFCADLHENN